MDMNCMIVQEQNTLILHIMRYGDLIRKSGNILKPYLLSGM